jgi:hypothetical protein
VPNPELKLDSHVSDLEMDAMDACDNFELPKPHSTHTSVRIHDAFRAFVSRSGLICAVCDEMHFLPEPEKKSAFGPNGFAHWHVLSGDQLLQYQDLLSLPAGTPPLPHSVVVHYQLHQSVRVSRCVVRTDKHCSLMNLPAYSSADCCYHVVA